MVWICDLRRLFFATSICVPNLLLSPSPAPAQVYIGLDQDGDLNCDRFDDMTINPVVEGDHIDVDVYWDNTNQGLGGLLSINTTVCIAHYGFIENDTFTYDEDLPVVWTLTPVWNSLDKPATVHADQWIVDTYPCYECWLTQGTDFTFSSPIPDGVNRFGTLSFDIAKDGSSWLDMIIDGDPFHTGWFAADYSSGGCTGGLPQDESCVCVGGAISDRPPGYDPCAVEKLSWGSLKTLFRDEGAAAREAGAQEIPAPLSKTPGSCSGSN